MTALGNNVRLLVGGLASAAAAAVTSVFGRTGAVVALAADYAAFYAPKSLTVTAVNASRAILATDNNSLLVCDTSGGAIVLTVNNSVMSGGETVCIEHVGANALSVTNGVGVTITSRGSLFNSAGAGAYTGLVFKSATAALFVGDRA